MTKIDEEISKTRSYDKGGQDDQEIKLKLSSLQYVRRRIETCISSILANTNLNTNKASSHGSNSSSTPNMPAKEGANLFSSSGVRQFVLNSHVKLFFLANFNLFFIKEDEYKTFLFNQHLANLDFTIVITNESIQHCFIGKNS